MSDDQEQQALTVLNKRSRSMSRISSIALTACLVVIAIAVPAVVVLNLPLVPNWPYVGAIAFVVSLIAGFAYIPTVWGQLRKPDFDSPAWLIRAFPVCLLFAAISMSYVYAVTEEKRCLQFSDGVIVEKYKSRNHQYLSVRVDVTERGTVAVEGISPSSWENVALGSVVSKNCGATDIVIEAR